VAGTCYTSCERFRQMALAPGALDGIEDEVLQRFLDAASRKAESLGLRARYKLPLLTWDDDLEQQVCSLAVWPVMTYAGYNPEAGQNNQYRAITEGAEQWFRDLGARRVHPAITDSTSRSPTPMAWSNPKRGW
jgi:phage gp36-like protein